MQTFDFDTLFQAFVTDYVESHNWLKPSDVTLHDFLIDADSRIESRLQDGEMPEDVHVWIVDQGIELGLRF